MDRRFNSENFEGSLKTYADDFKMMPSKKVWHGIYNDLHPGTRWPSVAMSLVFIFTLVIIGHLNTNNSNVLAALNSSGKTVSSEEAKVIKKKTKSRQARPLHNTQPRGDNYNSGVIPGDAAYTESYIIPDQFILPVTLQNNTGENSYNPVNPDLSENNTKSNPTDDMISSNKSAGSKNADVTANNDKNVLNDDPAVKGNLTTSVAKQNTEEVSEKNTVSNNIKITESKKEEKLISDKEAAAAKHQIKTKTKDVAEKQQQKTSGNSFLSKKVRDKMSITYYASPSISYRSLSEKNIVSTSQNTSSASSSPNFLNSGAQNSVINKAIIGFEAGAGLNYKLSKRWQATMGLQLNYLGYNIKANNVHPVSTSLLLISDFTGEPYAFNSMSNYGNATGSSKVTLHHYSVQASAPFGLKYMIGGNDKIQLNAEASFQPSLVIANKAYLLSADKRNYVTESTLLRSLNMSTNFGTYVSFKSNSLNWQIGPQVFYQVFSTYTHNYPTQEHLMNYGIRFGVSKLKK